MQERRGGGKKEWKLVKSCSLLPLMQGRGKIATQIRNLHKERETERNRGHEGIPLKLQCLVNFNWKFRQVFLEKNYQLNDEYNMTVVCFFTSISKR